MKINSSMIGMESARSYTQITKKAFIYSTSQRRIGNLQTTLHDAHSDKEDAFKEALKEKAEQSEAGAVEKEGYIASGGSIHSVASIKDKKTIESIREQCLQYLIYWLFTGRSSGQRQSFSQWQQENQQLQAEQPAPLSKEVMVTNMHTHADTSYKETETTDFSTRGTVVTADGRQIEFNLELTMSRSFEAYYEENYTKPLVQTVDPLVINLEDNVASVSDQKFEFDIDGDGILDRISRLGKGSGYLALDKNGDGIINDGNELFGTKSGNGFYDLSRYDQDGNGWIDENDEIWDKLLIWTQDENGKDELYHLSQVGVGAICLQKVKTDFSLNSLKDNQTNGQIKSTGIFLYENGNVGTVQHLDLTR